MKIMSNLPPTDYQLEQARKFYAIVGDTLNVDDFDETLQNDDAFELWDNIATQEYERQGGEFNDDDPNEPSDSRLFEDCQEWATDFILGLHSQKTGNVNG
jgi:hypothetical protein